MLAFGSFQGTCRDYSQIGFRQGFLAYNDNTLGLILPERKRNKAGREKAQRDGKLKIFEYRIGKLFERIREEENLCHFTELVYIQFFSSSKSFVRIPIFNEQILPCENNKKINNLELFGFLKTTSFFSRDPRALLIY